MQVTPGLLSLLLIGGREKRRANMMNGAIRKRNERETRRDGGRNAHLCVPVLVYRAWSWLYGHGPSHPYITGTERVGFSPTGQTLPAPNAKRREVLGESHEG